MWFVISAASGLLATGIMLVLCFAIGSAPMAAGHIDYTLMYFVILTASLLSAFGTRRRSWPLVLLGSVLFSIPVVLFSRSRHHDFAVADPNRWGREARQWSEITLIAPLIAVVCAIGFAIFSRPSKKQHEITAMAFPPNKSAWPFQESEGEPTSTNKQVICERQPILFVSRDAEDGRWFFVTGRPYPVEDILCATLREVVEYDPTVCEVADLPWGWKAEREKVGAPWKRSRDLDEDARNVG